MKIILTSEVIKEIYKLIETGIIEPHIYMNGFNFNTPFSINGMLNVYLNKMQSATHLVCNYLNKVS